MFTNSPIPQLSNSPCVGKQKGPSSLSDDGPGLSRQLGCCHHPVWLSSLTTTPINRPATRTSPIRTTTAGGTVRGARRVEISSISTQLHRLAPSESNQMFLPDHNKK